MTQLHVNMEAGLYLKLKTAIRQLGYSSISEWAREMARRTVREIELRPNYFTKKLSEKQ